LIPEFSLPGTSIGTEEANAYMSLRSKKVSQITASRLFVSFGLSDKYGISLEKRFNLSGNKARALFPDETDVLHNPFLLFTPPHQYIKSSVVLTVNYLFLDRGYNPLYFSRNNILRIREIKQGSRFPLNLGATLPDVAGIDSS
jgi:hypothetical protein